MGDAKRERERSILEDQVQRLTRALATTHDALTAKEAEVQRVQAELEEVRGNPDYTIAH